MEDITAWNVSLKAMRFKNTLCYSKLLWIFFCLVTQYMMFPQIRTNYSNP